MRFGRVVVSAACLLVAVVAWGGRFKNTGPSQFPRIDVDGSLLTVDPDACEATLTVNTKKGKGRITAKGHAQNLSEVRQKYENSAVLLDVMGLPNPVVTEVVKSVYKVSDCGCTARANLSVKVDVTALETK